MTVEQKQTSKESTLPEGKENSTKVSPETKKPETSTKGPTGKTSTPKVVAKKPPAPKVLESVIQASEMTVDKNYKLKALIVGKSGTGKRTGATTLPGRKLLIDYDNRSESVAGLPDVDVIKVHDPDPKSPRAWLQAEKLRREIWAAVRKGTFPYDCIIEATLTSMLRIAMNWSLMLDPKKGLGETPAQQHYMPQMYNVEQHIHAMKELPLHYVLTAHVELVEDEQVGGIVYLPKATGKMRTAIPGWFNECYHSYTDKDKEGNPVYFWNTTGVGRWDFLKSTLNQLGKFWKSPVRVNFNKERVGFQVLLDHRFGIQEEEDG